MFGSQALETVIGVAAMLFILATTASALTEVLSRLLKKRARNLEATIRDMLTGPEPGGDLDAATLQAQRVKAVAVFDAFKATSVWHGAVAASGRALIGRKQMGASYLSAKSFADAVTEMLAHDGIIDDLGTVPSLQRRLKTLVRESDEGLLDVKSGLESWFDETMNRAEGSYKRWAALVLFCAGLFLTVSANASVVDVAHDLWSEPATRAVVTESASRVVDSSDDLKSVAQDTEQLTQLSLPIGWDVHQRDPERDDSLLAFLATFPQGNWWGTIGGWLATSLLVMLGGPFWFDLLTRLVGMRATGTKPATAVNDTTSATQRTAAASAATAATVGPAAVPAASAGPAGSAVGPIAVGDELAALRTMLRLPSSTP
jgi:hypothetical protein